MSLQSRVTRTALVETTWTHMDTSRSLWMLRKRLAAGVGESKDRVSGEMEVGTNGGYTRVWMGGDKTRTMEPSSPTSLCTGRD